MREDTVLNPDFCANPRHWEDDEKSSDPAKELPGEDETVENVIIKPDSSYFVKTRLVVGVLIAAAAVPVVRGFVATYGGRPVGLIPRIGQNLLVFALVSAATGVAVKELNLWIDSFVPAARIAEAGREKLKEANVEG